MRYDVVLFDLDHTLLDSDASMRGAYETTMHSVGIADADAVYPTFDRINQALWRRVEAHELSPNEVRVRRFEELLVELGIDGDAEVMAKTFVKGLVDCGELYDGAVELLEDLAGRARLGMVTNGIGKVQRGRIDRLGLAGYFDVVTISGEVGTNKPGREIFDMTLDAMNAPDRRRCVMIGDNLGSDILGGINADVDTIWFNPDGREATDEITPTAEVRSLPEIRERIRG